ncbi:PHP domain-containing protein [Pseudokineococcus sp. 1T1Z-3]|uniref:PHP domain-containing protein n=1 Tax=Pseudokineococcus sp. 1T1Z-3 TaxID=3132745 RepID=UPI0030A3CD60
MEGAGTGAAGQTGSPAQLHADVLAALRRVAFLLERELASTHRVKAFRGAATTVAGTSPEELARHVAGQDLQRLPGVGRTTAALVDDVAAGRRPAYLVELEARAAPVVDPSEEGAAGGAALRAALRGDLHLHSDWSDGGSPVEDMAVTAVELGHSYAALTDHSPRLRVANGLTPARLRRQLELLEQLAAPLAPFRLLSGIECDVLADGTLDQEPDLLDQLDVVVASVHSDLRMERGAMTRRMVRAVQDPRTDVLGHCTGRYVQPRPRVGGGSSRGVGGGSSRNGGRTRPESEFDADVVFAACAEAGVAVEINSRPERLDPPLRLLRQAEQAGCLFSVDTDAHAPGQLDWQERGCARAARCGVPAERVVNTWPVEDLLAWTADHTHRPG